MLAMPGNMLRNSTASANSPRCSNAVRIVVASASLTQNMGEDGSLPLGLVSKDYASTTSQLRGGKPQ